jgi:hypothetical protein
MPHRPQSTRLLPRSLSGAKTLPGKIAAQEPGLRGSRFPAQARVLSGSANGVFVTVGGVAGEDPLPGSAGVEDLHAQGPAATCRTPPWR